MSNRFQAVFAVLLLCGLAACDGQPESGYREGPKGYVEFYLPEPAAGGEDLGIDVQVYRIDNGRRSFLGMTRKWGHLAEPRRGLTVPVAPGRQDFVVVFGGAEAPVTVEVGDGSYLRVRVEPTGLDTRQVLGTMRQLSFGLKATPEPAQ